MIVIYNPMVSECIYPTLPDQSYEATEYIDSISAERWDPSPNESPVSDG